MKFELTYQEINFLIELNIDNHFIPNSRFEKLSKNTLISLKKNELVSYSLIIESKKENITLTHYFYSIILTSNKDELLEDLQDYLENEPIIEEISKYWETAFIIDGPKWKI
jgi:hypothetical protein